VFQRQDTSDLAGKWLLATIGGVKMPPGASAGDQAIDILPNGNFSWPSLSITGKWKADDARLILHPEKYDGKTPEQFRAETQAKYPSDAAMQKIADKVFEDLKLTIGADSTTLSIDMGGTVQTFAKERMK
jgi:hypothetical protein